MTEKNIQTLKEEGLRIIDLLIASLNELEGKGIISDSVRFDEDIEAKADKDSKNLNKVQKAETFDKKSLLENVEILQGESVKLQNLEMVVAVVGTMKAGKSTTINAIVGTEILPNRNRPMTALPTLIRHAPDVVTPVLRFKQNKPINDLIAVLHSVIKKFNDKAILADLNSDSDMKELLIMISKKAVFKTEYVGRDKIYWFLKILNDLVRLSGRLGVDFPFDSYSQVKNLPVIEVEFVHLKGRKSTGQLTLLDTPGPNEAGQTHLRTMLKEQLSKASAVLAVMDYTQLKSDADAQIRIALEQISGVAKNRIYAIVNKFDQKDSHGDESDEVKSRVAKDLMGSDVSFRGRVFPVSSNQAYLARRMLHEIDPDGRLPVLVEKSWVADFCKVAFGMTWDPEDDYQSVRVSKAANRLWEKSLFNEPLEKIIHTAHAQAAIQSIASAAAKLVDISLKLHDFLEIRGAAFSKSAVELKRQIDSLQKNSDEVDKAKIVARNKSKSMLDQMDKDAKRKIEETKDKIKISLDEYFQEGKKMEEEEINEKIRMRRGGQFRKKKENPGVNDNNGSSFIHRLLGLGVKDDDIHFDPKKPIIQFDDKGNASKLIENIRSTVDDCVKAGEGAVVDAVELLKNDFSHNFVDEIEKTASNICRELNDGMRDDGFSVKIKLPNIQFPSLEISAIDLLDGMVQEKTKDVRDSRRSSGAWGTVCRWFDTKKWGYETYYVKKDYFEINIDHIKNSVLNGVDMSFSVFQESIVKSIQDPLEIEVSKYFNEFNKKIGNISADLSRGIQDQRLKKEQSEKLSKYISQAKKNSSKIYPDAEELAIDVDNLLKSGMKVALS